ncbi:MAG: tetratricopeptide repeat protein, partial [Bdellovibrionaceae bacterium]|nr:tetratricopeptide repeat protein [Pseudobdellovibrionaceae bacterium]
MLGMFFSRTFLFASLFLVVPAAFGQLDDGNRNLLIEKLDKVYQNLAPNDSSKVAVTLRLADLYAERARVNSMKELDINCTDCKVGDGDRKKALKLYTEVMGRAPESSKGKIMIQVGHLYQITGEEPTAITFYQKILNEKTEPVLQAEAQLSLGEIYFKRRDYAKAQPFFKEVVKNPAATSRGLAAYRDAWCSFNLGNVALAITQMENVLKNPALLTRSGSAQSQVDPQFHEEVSRDFATFIAKKQISKADIDSLYALSPDAAKVENVKGLALEAERIGKKAEALQVWNFVYGYMSKPEDRLAAKISMAQLQFDISDRKAGAETFESAMELWKDLKTCQSSQCDELRRRSRQFVVSWNQLEK